MRALTRRENGEEAEQWGLHLAPWGFPHLATWFWQNEAEFFDGATLRTSAVSDTAVEALDFLLTLTREERVAPYLGHSNVFWEGSDAILHAPAISTDGGTAGPQVPVGAWVAPAHQEFYASGHSSIKRTLGLAQLPHNRRRASLLMPTALLAVSSASPLDSALQQAIPHITSVLESDSGFGLPLRRHMLSKWAEQHTNQADDEFTEKNVRQAVAALEHARAAYADSTFDVAQWFDIVFPSSLIGMLSSDAGAKADVRRLLEIGFSRLNEDLAELCNPDGCRKAWEK